MLNKILVCLAAVSAMALVSCGPDCSNDNGGCDSNAVCTDTPAGSLTCTCGDGYSGDGQTCSAKTADAGTDAGTDADIDADIDAGAAPFKWSYETGGEIWSSPAIGADGTVYVGSFDKKLHAVNPDGKPEWSYETGGPIISSPTIGADGTVYIGSYDKKLHAVNPGGKPKWSYATGAPIVSSPTIGADGTVYVGSWDGKLYAFGP